MVESESSSSALTSYNMRVSEGMMDDAVLLVAPGAVEILDKRIEGDMLVIEYRVIPRWIAITFTTSFQQEESQ